MGVEYELKFRANKQALRELAAAFPDGHTRYAMVTTYYDTPSGALSARHYTLRHRMENENHVCTLKTPAAGQGRNELEISCRELQAAIPQFCKMGAPADFADMVAEGLVPVCGARFYRIAIPVAWEECRLELALDEGVLIGGGREVPLCEVEVELKSGNPADADMFALVLATQHHLTPETKSKFRRSLDLYKGV